MEKANQMTLLISGLADSYPTAAGPDLELAPMALRSTPLGNSPPFLSSPKNVLFDREHYIKLLL